LTFGVVVCLFSIQVGIDVASHVQDFLTKADLGVRMQGGTGAVLEEVSTSNHIIVVVVVVVVWCLTLWRVDPPCR